MKKLTLLVIAMLALSGSYGQTFNKIKFDSLFTVINANDKGMGSVSLYINGLSAYGRAIGYADVDKKILNKVETKFRIGSISKTFTAVIIMQMVDEKKLTLDTKLDKFYPQIPNAKKITIEQLLRHRSGIHNFTDDDSYTTWMEKPQTHKEMIKRFSEMKSDFEPGEKHSYSNTNYVLLSYIAEKIDKKDFAQILSDRITVSCGLKSTLLAGKINPEQNEARSYRREGNSWIKATETDASVPIGAGAIESTASDLNKFMNCLFRGKLVSAESLEKMKTMVDGYGIGLIQFPFYDKKVYGHTGGIDGFQSFAGYFPDDHVGLAYVSNGVAMSRNDIIIGALSIYFDKEYTLPEFKGAISLKADDLVNFPGTYAKEGFPLKLKIFREGDKLFGQGSGQPSFPLTATGKETFINEAAGINIRFAPEESKLYLKQGGRDLEMVREKE